MEKRKVANIHWLPEEEYQKAVTQLRMQLNSENGVFAPFRLYGLEPFIPGAIGEVVRLAEDFSLRVRGIDKPISLELLRRKSGSRNSSSS